MLLRRMSAVLVVAVMLVHLNDVQACCGKSDTALDSKSEILKTKTEIFKRMLNEAVDGKMETVNQIGWHVKNNADKYSIPFGVAVCVLVYLMLSEKKKNFQVEDGGSNYVQQQYAKDVLVAAVAAVAAAALAGWITSVAATPLLRYVGSRLAVKGRNVIPVMIELAENWESVKSMVPEHCRESLEIVVKNFKEHGSFTPTEEKMIKSIFEQFVAA